METIGNGAIREVLSASKSNGLLPSVAIFNVTGQSEGSVSDGSLTMRECPFDPVDKDYFQSAPFRVFVS